MKYIFAIIFLFFSSVVFAQYKNQDLVGKWEGMDNTNEPAMLAFKSNGKVDVRLGTRALHDLDYKVYLIKTPAPLDIAIKSLDGKQQITLKCFIQFIDNNTLKWQIFDSGNRPNPDSKSLTNTIALNDAITINLKRKKT